MGDSTECVWPRCFAEASVRIKAPLCDRHALNVYRQVREMVDDQARRQPPPVVPAQTSSARPEFGASHGLVYYVRLGDRVKIGFTTNLPQRMEVVPHEQILLVRPGTMTDERAEHHRWARLRTAGEWFKAEPDLLNYIASLT